MTTTIEHQVALARIEEMRRYADATGGTVGRRGDATRGAGHEPSRDGRSQAASFNRRPRPTTLTTDNDRFIRGAE